MGTELQPLISAGLLRVDTAREPFDEHMPLSAQQSQLDMVSFRLGEAVKTTQETISRQRYVKLVATKRAEYAGLVDQREFKAVCMVCRCRKDPRSHHWKECGRCVRKLDHHCPWIDNCVGWSNQRTFFWFIVILLALIADFYYATWVYLAHAVIHAWQDTGKELNFGVWCR